jgi:hypothetical protein
MEGRLFRLGVPVATGLLFAILGYLHMVVLPGMAGGEATLDLRAQGYNVLDVQHYLEKLTPQGAILYQGWVRVLDTVLPLLGMMTLLIPLRIATGLLSKLALPAILYCALDLLENQAVSRLIATTNAGDLPSEVLVVWASKMTQWKTAAFFVAVLIAIAAMIFNAQRKR